MLRAEQECSEVQACNWCVWDGVSCGLGGWHQKRRERARGSWWLVPQGPSRPPTAFVTVNGEKTLTSSTEVRSVFKKGTPDTSERVGRCWVDQGTETGQDFLSQWWLPRPARKYRPVSKNAEGTEGERLVGESFKDYLEKFFKECLGSNWASWEDDGRWLLARAARQTACTTIQEQFLPVFSSCYLFFVVTSLTWFPEC